MSEKNCRLGVEKSEQEAFDYRSVRKGSGRHLMTEVSGKEVGGIGDRSVRKRKGRHLTTEVSRKEVGGI